MWWNRKARFVYFFVDEFEYVNNNKKKFGFAPFKTDKRSKDDWASNGISRMLSPETLTYWNEE